MKGIGGPLIILKMGLPTAIKMAVVNISYLLITGMLNNFGVPVAAASRRWLKSQYTCRHALLGNQTSHVAVAHERDRIWALKKIEN